MDIKNLKFRYEVVQSDVQKVLNIARETGLFSENELEIAVELVEERLSKRQKSGYNFIICEDAQNSNNFLGYSCYGLIPCTSSSYDLYWIVVNKGFHNLGLGKLILKKTEELIIKLGGTRIYAETSMRKQYESTRFFYEKSGFYLESVLKDFYSVGDSKATYCKIL